jgi:shikimate 5-dehydrogenase
MHKASFKALGIDADYIALDVPREGFATATASALRS